MPKTLRDDPVIVLGMHHSGTSILTEVLHRHGIFMHANMQHYESRFFTTTVDNEALMGGDGRWANSPIMSVAEVMAKVDVARALIDQEAYQRYVSDGYDGSSRWGFKDPRTCVLLPLYLAVFPHAQLLHIIRNGDDVAKSLARSRKKGVGRNLDRSHWKDLWRQHVDRAREYGRKHARYYEFRYEEFAKQPVVVTRLIFEYLNLELSPAAKTFLRDNVKSGIRKAPK